MPTRGGSKRGASKTFTALHARQAAERERRAQTKARRSSRPEAVAIIKPHVKQHDFWLVQRIIPTTRPGKGWFNNLFEMDYMGAAEFEFGATHQAVANMRETGDFRITSVLITRKGTTRTVFCVTPGSDEATAQKLADFMSWATQDYPRAMEYTHFSTLFDEDFRFTLRKYIETVAWWSLDDDILWTLDLEVAEQLLHGLEHPATA